MSNQRMVVRAPASQRFLNPQSIISAGIVLKSVSYIYLHAFMLTSVQHLKRSDFGQILSKYIPGTSA